MVYLVHDPEIPILLAMGGLIFTLCVTVIGVVCILYTFGRLIRQSQR